MKTINILFAFLALATLSATAAETEGTPSNLQIPSAVKAIVLPSNWASKMGASSGGSSKTIADLYRLFSNSGTPDATLECPTPINIYEGVSYLMPLNEARIQLKLNSMGSKSKIACAGLPDGLYYYSFDGKWEGNYNKLYLVTDQRDQVVSVELVDEDPKGFSGRGYRNPKNHTYDFVNTRVKAMDFMEVAYRLGKSEKNDSNAFAVDLTFINPKLSKTLKVAKWYIPQPLVNLILVCVDKSGFNIKDDTHSPQHHVNRRH